MKQEEGKPLALTGTIFSQDETNRASTEIITPAEKAEGERRQIHFAAEPPRLTLGSSFRGIGGALLGALVGALPWSIAGIFFHDFVCLLGFLIGVGAFYGYKGCKGPRRMGFAFTVILLCSVVFICITEYADCFNRVWSIIMETLKTEGSTLTDTGFFKVTAYCASTTFAVMFDAEMIGSVLNDLAIGLVAGTLGILLIRKYIAAYVNEGSVPAEACGVPEIHTADKDSRPEQPV